MKPQEIVLGPCCIHGASIIAPCPPCNRITNHLSYALTDLVVGPHCEHEREGHSYLPIAEITRLRNIEDAAQAVVDFWEGPPYVTDDDEISREINHLRLALEARA